MELNDTFFYCVNAGFSVYLFARLAATPLVPYAVLLKKALAGVMITASHNPKDDNGYKVCRSVFSP